MDMDFNQICSPPGKFIYFQEKITFPESIKVLKNVKLSNYLSMRGTGVFKIPRKNGYHRESRGLPEVYFFYDS